MLRLGIDKISAAIAKRSALLLAACALLISGCITSTSSPGVFLATNPPGARVYVDGKDTGFATPCALSLDKASEHEVAFLLDGYNVARRELYPGNSWEVVPWSDGDIGFNIWRFPIFLTFRGLFFPFGLEDNLVPSHLYVSLEVATQPG